MCSPALAMQLPGASGSAAPPRDSYLAREASELDRLSNLPGLRGSVPRMNFQSDIPLVDSIGRSKAALEAMLSAGRNEIELRGLRPVPGDEKIDPLGRANYPGF